MDKLDLQILEFLQIDGRTPFTEIAHELKVSEGTIRNRVTKLIEDETIQIVGMINPASLGLSSQALIGVSIQDANLQDAANMIAELPEVNSLIMVSGEFDLFVGILCKSQEHLANFVSQQLRQVPGVFRTQTFMTLETFKGSYGPLTIPLQD